MSRYVASLVYRKKIGSMARKSILAYCAERANDDGSGVWSSKVTISKEVECSKKTVIETVNAFVAEGILIVTGRRKISNGFVHVYQINLPSVERLEDAITKDELRGVNLHPSPDVTSRGEAELPQGVTSGDPNRPRTVLKPSNAQERADGLFSEDDQQEDPQDTFDDFWKAYPKKTGKPAAKKVWERLIKTNNPSEIIEGAERYSRLLKANNPSGLKFVKHPQGWLNDGRWTDAELWTSAATVAQLDWSTLSDSARRMLQRGQCPPSMMVDGQPNDIARAFMAQVAK